MTALVVAQLRLKDPEMMAAYAEAAMATLKPFGGEIIHRGKYEGTLLGDAAPHGLGIMSFPDPPSARSWFNSPEYQAVAPLREAAADMTFVLYNLGD